MAAVHALLLVAQVVVPLAFLAWLWFSTGGSRSGTLLRLFMTTAYLVAIALVGLWLIVPWPLTIVYFAILALQAYAIGRRVQSVPRWPQRRVEWFGLALNGLIAIAFVGLAGTAIRARWPPQEQIVDLEFPLHDGTYLVANGGSSDLINAHVQTLTAPRFVTIAGRAMVSTSSKSTALACGRPALSHAIREPMRSSGSLFMRRVRVSCCGRQTVVLTCRHRSRIVSISLATSSSWSVVACTSFSVTWSEARCRSVPASTFTLVLSLGTSGIQATPTSRTCTFMRSVPRRTTRS